MAYVVAERFETSDLLDLMGMDSSEGPAIYNGLELDVSIVNPTRPDGSNPSKHLLKIGNGGDLQDDVMSAEFIVDSDPSRFGMITDARGRQIEEDYIERVKLFKEEQAYKTLLNQIDTAFGSEKPSSLETLIRKSSLNRADIQTIENLEKILDPSSDLARIQNLLNEARLKNHPFLRDLRSKILGGRALTPKQRAAIGKFERSSGPVDQTIVNRLNAQLKKNPNNKFLKSLKSQALSGRTLSPKQIAALENMEGGKKKPAKKKMTVAKFQTLGHHDRIKVILDHLTPSQFTPKNRNFKSETAKLLRELKRSGMRGTPLNRSYTPDELGALREIVDHLTVHYKRNSGNEFLESLNATERQYWVEGTLLMY